MLEKCPDCRMPMATQTYLGFDLDVCRECEGLWFDADELRRLMAADPLAMLVLEERCFPHVKQHKSRQGVFFCPACEGLLHVYAYQYDSQIEMEVCDDCGGFWVQEGELQKMQHWHDTHHTPSAAEAHKIALAKAAIEHDTVMHQQQNIHAFFNLLRQHKPLWLQL